MLFQCILEMLTFHLMLYLVFLRNYISEWTMKFLSSTWYNVLSEHVTENKISLLFSGIKMFPYNNILLWTVGWYWTNNWQLAHIDLHIVCRIEFSVISVRIQIYIAFISRIELFWKGRWADSLSEMRTENVLGRVKHMASIRLHVLTYLMSDGTDFNFALERLDSRVSGLESVRMNLTYSLKAARPYESMLQYWQKYMET